MENENPEITGAVYTVNSTNSYFDNQEISLKIYLREEPTDNPYAFKAFDISQNDKGTQYNAIFVNVQNINTSYETPASLGEHSYDCALSNLTQLSSMPGYSAFDCVTKDDAIVISLYNFTADPAEIQSYAEALFEMVKELVTRVITVGNFQDNLDIISGLPPRKTGVSRIPKL